ncbi:MAG: hypothetical protein ACREI9_14315 [Nitrospiraceae bacterium]
MTVPVSVEELLDGHVALEIDCLDRIYLNAYVPNLQVSGQVANFLTKHLGAPIPSPALFTGIGDRFRRDVKRFSEKHDVPLLRFGKRAGQQDERKSTSSARCWPRPSARSPQEWSRSGWRRSTRTCLPRPAARRTLRARRSSASVRKTAA